MVLTENSKRLIIYFFYDEDGIVDDYVIYMLESLKPHSSEIFVVVNGKLTVEGRQKISNVTNKILVRENKGFDVWAYKTAIDTYGWDELSKFDEVIFMNHTIMGPVFPFEEMFSVMNSKDLDFWGITAFHKVNFNPFNIEYGYIPKHIQSHWIAIRKTMLQSFELKKYWNERPNINSYADAVGKHEAIFTKKFEDFGYKWDVYADLDDSYTSYPLIKAPIELFEKKRCPIFKRRSFFTQYNDLLSESDGTQGAKIINYLDSHKLYQIKMIWDNILRTCDLSDIITLSNKYYIEKDFNHEIRNNLRLALVMHIYFDDTIDYCYKYACSMPSNSDIYITTTTENNRIEIQKIFANGPWKHINVYKIPNRGRDVSSLLVAFAPYVNNYDYVCFMHDKKVLQLDYLTKGFYFSERCFQNMLGSKENVLSIINRFESEPQLGLICPPPPNFSDYFSTEPSKWLYNYETTVNLSKELKIQVRIDKNKYPVAPIGTMFWFRTKGMEKLFSKKWKYEDFPKEPNKNNGTILHAIERIYSYTEQDAGYYTSYYLSHECAENELTNLSYIYKELTNKIFNIAGCHDLYGTQVILDQKFTNYNLLIGSSGVLFSNHKILLRIKDFIHLFIPNFIWIPIKIIYKKIKRRGIQR